MIMMKALLVVAAATFAPSASGDVAAFAQETRTIGAASRAFDLVADRDRDRNKDDDESDQGQFGPRNSSRGVTTNDDDDAPRALRHPEDQQLRDRIDRGDYQERDLDRLRGRNYRD